MAIDIGALTVRSLAGGWADVPEPATAADWLAARRHSRIVAVLRWILPAMAVVVVAWMFVSAHRLPREIGNIDLGEVGLEGTTLTMQNPSLSGFNKDGTAYQVTAAKALQDVTNPRVVTLEFVDGTLTKSDGSDMRLTADNGVFDNDTQTLELDGNIVVKTSKDENAYLESAKVDLGAGSIVSDRPIRAEANNGKIRADAMEVTERGARLRFSGKVVVELRLDGGKVEDGKVEDGKVGDDAAPDTAAEGAPADAN